MRQLGEGGKVVPVRLSLFAELMKARPWTRRSLREVGGIEGLGVTFLEETFASRSAHPEHRRQASAARAVLAALLPDDADVIRGRARRPEELLPPDSCGPYRLRSLLTCSIAMRLITHDREGEATPAISRARLSRVPHLAVAPAARADTRGRRLRLAERAAHWARQPQARFLPSLPEYVSMVAGVPRRRRQPAEQAMLRATTQRLGVRALVLVFAATLLGWGAWESHGRIRARGMVEAIEAATLAAADPLVPNELPPYPRCADDRLRTHAMHPEAPRDRRLRASLACLPAQAEFLAECLLDGSVADVAVIRARLVPFAALVSPRLTEVLNDPHQLPAVRFHAALALVVLHPDGDWPQAHAGFLARQLVHANLDEQATLRALLRPVGGPLIPGLRPLLRESVHEQAAALALADFGADQAELLAELAAEATPEQFIVLYPAVAQNQVALPWCRPWRIRSPIRHRYGTRRRRAAPYHTAAAA